MSTEPGKLIGTKLSFQMNHASMCEAMMATFVFDAIPVNGAFQSTLSNHIVAFHLEFLIWGVVLYHGRSNLLQIEGNLNSNKYVCEGLQP
ncbi:uncharacterized protein TNCV_4651861 [Trichonephila clavipes]|nr:uncharacterized protein TNCV_4651861 [Trichonephila clavipes]